MKTLQMMNDELVRILGILGFVGRYWRVAPNVNSEEKLGYISVLCRGFNRGALD